MRDRRNAIAFRQRENVEPARKPACASQVGLGDVDATSADEIAESVTGEFAFAPRHGDRILAPHFAVAFVVFRRNGLFEKLDLMRLHEPAHANG